MNAQEFISSGIIEAFVTGAATAAERAQVEDMAIRYPQVKAELDAAEDAMNIYLSNHAIAPPPHLKNQILNAIASTPVRVSSAGTIFAIAAAITLLVTLPLTIYMYMRMKTDENALASIQLKQQTLLGDMHDSALAYQGMRNKIYVLTDPMFKMILLKGMKAAPYAKALVCWCPGSKELYFEPEKMPAPPQGMQYQLWAIINGKPVNAGMIKMLPGMQKMKLIANAGAFAVTLEKQGGSPTPHGDTYMMGTI